MNFYFLFSVFNRGGIETINSQLRVVIVSNSKWNRDAYRIGFVLNWGKNHKLQTPCRCFNLKLDEEFHISSGEY